MTLKALVDLAAEKTGGPKALRAEVRISRQRLHSAMNGGPPLHAMRLVHLALAAGVDPVDALRCGGRSDFASLLERALCRSAELTPTHRLWLQAFQRLPEDDQRCLLRWMELVAYAMPVAIAEAATSAGAQEALRDAQTRT